MTFFSLASIATAQMKSVTSADTSSVPSVAPTAVSALPSAPAVSAVVSVAGPCTWIQLYSPSAGADWNTPAPMLLELDRSEVTVQVSAPVSAL
jgi:hypothetical protein